MTDYNNVLKDLENLFKSHKMDQDEIASFLYAEFINCSSKTSISNENFSNLLNVAKPYFLEMRRSNQEYFAIKEKYKQENK